ncbi:MAG: hypothetical protein P4L67_05240 [Candidatus Pacebacteria bacterium]|nr:hypothetical protein [Candidatus Paceibacterota bacterium]
MIRYGKRLSKKTIFDYVQCRDENSHADFVFADLVRQLEEREEELEAKDAELAEAAEPKACGAYRIVHEDEYAELKRQANIGRAKEELYFRAMDAKDAEIDRYKGATELAGKLIDDRNSIIESKDMTIADLERDMVCLEHERKASRLASGKNGETIGKLRGEVKTKDAEIASLKSDLQAVVFESESQAAEIIRQRDEARAELRKLQRLQSSESTYDANAVNGFSESAACSLVGLAVKILEDNGGKVPFSAACAVVLKRELDKAKAENKSLSEKNAELATTLHKCSTVSAAKTFTRSDAFGIGPVFRNCTFTPGE